MRPEDLDFIRRSKDPAGRAEIDQERKQLQEQRIADADANLRRSIELGRQHNNAHHVLGARR